MFWSNNSVSSTHLETLLSKEDVTLKELMDEEEVLQECKSQNKKLIDFLIRSDVLEELVRLTTVEPTDDEGNESMKYKYPNIACELLTCEVPQLNQRLANDEALLGKLYSFLEADPPLNPLLASFFSKTFSVLIARTSEQNWYSYQFTCLQVLEFLKSKENCVSLLLKHLGTSAIMDLLFKLITKVEGGEMKQNILSWLDDQKLVQNIVALLDPSVDSSVHGNAAQLMCDVIRTARENKKQSSDPDCILDRLESPETVSQLLDHILKEPKCETSIVGGISVLLTLLECENKETNEVMCNPYGSLAPAEDAPTPEATEPSKVVTNTIQAILPRLKDFHDVLINPPLKPSVMTTIGLLDPPLGNTRVEVAKLLSVLVANNNLEINSKLAELDTINILLDLFFKYTWNNFLHTQVEQCLAFALNADLSSGEEGEVQKNCLIAHILVKCRLLERILEAWQDNEVQQNVNNLPRRGYMGHLIRISNSIVQQMTEKGPLGAFIKETVDSETFKNWEEFVNTKLAEINKIYNTCLGGTHPAQSSNDDSNVECKDLLFNLDNNLQELYTNYYQLQALAPSFNEQFGSYQEEQFNDNEDVLNSSTEPNLQKLSFNINEEDLDQQAVLFEQVCAQKFQTLDDDDGDIWSKRVASSKTDENAKNDDWIFEDRSSDEEEEEPPERSGPEGREDVRVESDTVASWPGENENIVAPLQDSNPWVSSSAPPPSEMNAVTSPDQGWANFESAPFVANFGLNLSSDINTTIASSGSCEIDTIPLDLTPSDSNVNVNDMFSKENEQMEAPQVVENVPQTAVITDVDAISNAMEKIEISDKEEPNPKIEAKLEVANDSQVNNVEKPESVGDVNSVTNDQEEELIDNFRFLSNQGLITKCEENREVEPESGGDGYQFNKENVQAVPNETTQNSNKNMDIIGSHSPTVTTANGPV